MDDKILRLGLESHRIRNRQESLNSRTEKEEEVVCDCTRGKTEDEALRPCCIKQFSEHGMETNGAATQSVSAGQSQTYLR